MIIENEKTECTVSVDATLVEQAARDDQREGLVELLKSCVTDPNKTVRLAAKGALFHLDVPAERKQREFVPLLVDMLADRSGTVRRKAAYELLWHSDYVPLERASLALANVGSDEWTRRILSRLVRKIIEPKG